MVFQARLSALRFPCFARSPGQSVLGLLVRRDDGSLDYHLNPPRLWQAVRRGEVGIHEALLRAAERPSACKRSGWEMIHWVSFSLSGSVCCVLLQASNIMHALLGAALVALINLSPNVHVRAFAALRVFTGHSVAAHWSNVRLSKDSCACLSGDTAMVRASTGPAFYGTVFAGKSIR
jgi:hypothetical protein